MRAPLAIALLAALAACSPDRETGPTEHPAPANGQLLECRVDATALTFECGAPSGPERVGGLGTFGDQGINIALESKKAKFNGLTQVFSVEVTVENLMGGPIGTPDGSAVSGVDVFFLNEPAGAPSGTVTVSNPTGHQDFIGSTQPYFHYPSKLNPGAKSAPLLWQFQFAGGPTSFTFWVLVSAETPAQGAIQNWVLVPTFGAPPLQGIAGFGTDGQVIFGDSGEVSYRVGGVWRSIYDTLAAPSVSGRYLFASSTRRIWNYVDVGGLRKARRWDGGNWRPMDELQGYPGQLAIGIGATHPDSIWAFGTGLWKLVDDTMWVAQTMPPGATFFRAMAPIGADPLLVDQQGKAWLHHGTVYTQVAGVASGQLNPVSLFAADTSHFWILSDDPGDPDLRHFDAGSWSTPTPPGGYTRADGFHPLMGIALSGNEAYIIANKGEHGVVLRWNGSSWLVDREDLLVSYTGIWARNSNEIQLSRADGTVEVRRGGSWVPNDPQAVRPDPHLFLAAWLSAPGEGYLINELGFIYHYAGGEPVVVDTSTVHGSPGAGVSLWSSGPNNAWISFGGSQLWHHVGPGSGVFPVPGFNIRGVGGSASNDVWGVANEGQIVHFDGVSWSQELGFDCGGCDDWNAVWAFGPNFAVAVGDNGQIGIYSSGTWTVTQHGPRHLYAVSGSSPIDVWAVGQTGNAWHWDGSAWLEEDLPTPKDARGVWIGPAGGGYAITNGDTFRWEGLSWRKLDIPAMRRADNYAITGFGNDAFIVGERLFRGLR